jgi:hypothetical protein
MMSHNSKFVMYVTGVKVRGPVSILDLSQDQKSLELPGCPGCQWLKIVVLSSNVSPSMGAEFV